MFLLSLIEIKKSVFVFNFILKLIYNLNVYTFKIFYTFYILFFIIFIICLSFNSNIFHVSSKSLNSIFSFFCKILTNKQKPVPEWQHPAGSEVILGGNQRQHKHQWVLVFDLMNSVMFFGVSWFVTLTVVFGTIKISKDG